MNWKWQGGTTGIKVHCRYSSGDPQGRGGGGRGRIGLMKRWLSEGKTWVNEKKLTCITHLLNTHTHQVSLSLTHAQILAFTFKVMCWYHISISPHQRHFVRGDTGLTLKRKGLGFPIRWRTASHINLHTSGATLINSKHDLYFYALPKPSESERISFVFIYWLSMTIVQRVHLR